MEYELVLEQYLYKELETARKQYELHKEVVNKALTAGGDIESMNVEIHERLAQVMWDHSISILEIIYHFEEQKRAS